MKAVEFTRAQLLRLTRVYRTQIDAGKAVGCRPASIGRALKKAGIPSPWRKQPATGEKTDG